MIVFDIKRYAINDGPGIRTTVFLKGCPLRCVWCHNPESWLAQPELLFKAKKCIGCNTCGIHPHQLEKIKDERLKIKDGHAQSSVAALCPTLALEVCGRDWSVEELMAEIEKERDIMQDSGGGVTFSGGEPLMQHQALLAMLKACGERGFHRVVDTTLYASPDVVRAVAAETDLFLVDLKVMDPVLHKRYTGVSNERILSNLRLVAELGTPFQIRIPLIEGINADEANIEATAQFLTSQGNSISHLSSSISHLSSSISNLPISLLPYHEMGRDKHARRGSTYNPDNLSMHVPSDATLNRCISQFANHGLLATVG